MARVLPDTIVVMPVATVVQNGTDLTILNIRALNGPNYWRLAPVILCDINLGSLKDFSSVDTPSFTTNLLRELPSLSEHPCTRDKAGGFIARLKEGTYLPHILEHVALELQIQAGSDVSFGRVVPTADEQIWSVVIEYEEEDVGIQSFKDAVQIISSCIDGTAPETQKIINNLHELNESVRLGPSTAAIVDEARRRGIPVRRLNSGSLIRLGLGKNLRRIEATLTDFTSAIAVEIAQDKEDTKQFLINVGLPVPEGGVAKSADSAVQIWESLQCPVILKPFNSNQGRGVSGPANSKADIIAGFAKSSQFSSKVIVEQQIKGRDFRVLVVNGKVVAAAERIPAHVIGDGTRSISQLIDITNADTRRGNGHRKTLTKILKDEAVIEFLLMRGLTLENIPKKGERVTLCTTANLSTGGTSSDVTDIIHPENITACEIAASAIGLDIAGIDVISEDISKPFRENNAAIIEVNAAPGLRMHTHPTHGKPRNAGGAILDMLYPSNAETTIPIIAVTGTNGKTTTSRLIAHIYRHTGKTVGLTTTDGIYINNRVVMKGDMTGPFSANIILSNPTVEIAVLETARGGMLRSGLGFEEIDVGVVLNVSEDHLGMYGIQTIAELAEVKGIIAAVVKRGGHAVLNADDELVLAMQDKTPGDVVLISTSPDNPAVLSHTEEHGVSATVEDGSFVIRRAALKIPIATVNEVPLMIGGAAEFQKTNILAAIATAYVKGVRYDDIRAGIMSFFPSPAMTPGRLNLIRVKGKRILIDYAHNGAAAIGLANLTSNIKANRRIAVISGPGDRRDEDLLLLGSLFSSFDHVIVREDSDRRGRAEGEASELLQKGLLTAGLSFEKISLIADEAMAIEAAIKMASIDDIVVILTEYTDKTFDILESITELEGGLVA